MDELSLTFGPFRLNPANGTLLHGTEPLPIGQRAIRLLHVLLQRRGEVLTKGELLDAAWPDATVEEGNLHVQIASLRKVLGQAPDGGEWIVTMPRVGYRFVPDQKAAEGAEGAAANVRWRMGLRDHPRYLRWVGAMTAFVLTATLGFVLMRPGGVGPPSVAWANPSIAVLPFDDMTGDPAMSYFGDGVSEDIISMLARFPDIIVVSRNSSFRFKGRAVDIREVGEALGASHVLEGSVRRDADRLRIVAQLIDAKTGNHVWADRFDRTGTDPWALQDEVTDKIVASLVGNRGVIRRAEFRDAWGKDSADLLEYDYYLRAFDLVNARTLEAHERAEAIWREGLAKFPDSSLLKVQGANLHLLRFVRDWTGTPEEEFRRAGELARGAMAEPNLPPMTRRNAHYALAFVNLAERNVEQGLAEAEAAIALSPHDAAVYFTMAEIPIAIGRPERALEWIDRAASMLPEQDPMQAVVQVYRAWALTIDRQSEEVLAVLADPRIEPLRAIPSFGRYIRVLRVVSLMGLDRQEEAREEVADLLRLDPELNQVRLRQRNLHFEAWIVDLAVSALAAAGLPE